ncbi:alginate O-acetylation protein [Haloferula helveola]|uniref:Alginate O-acetylation protein n=1 Tax=Haloferula helveola TaxID=490095 RepID=A0ABM7RIN3_9BACT|nr:alginate O-acetylation protein [Haloferula helveola]
MIFNSYTFLLLFLPLTLLGFHLVAKRKVRVGFAWLVLMSLVYYGWWNPNPDEPWSPWWLSLILGSSVANFFFGRAISRNRGAPPGKVTLIVGVVANLGVLAWFKYAGLFAKTLAALTGAGLTLPDIILPLGISFFTFQQIAYLVDAWRGETEEYHFTDYLLFVTFFPQLIAGPIVHHKEMLPQFQKGRYNSQRWVNFSVGITILIAGLFKKVVLADNFAAIATRLFSLAATGERDMTVGEAWAAATTYGLQIYFDFSGYSDMAIGAARLFGIRLPLNFHSPYKATSVVDFWRRWHMTLSRFLRDYLYIAIGGNRCGKVRRYANLMITMALGGLWHGAGWTFLLWGVLHGIYLCANHAWFALRKAMNWPALPKPLAIALTFIAVLVAWVPFRAGNFELGPNGSTEAALRATRSVLASMFGLNGFEGWPDRSAMMVKDSHAIRAVLCVLLVWLLPNTQQWMRRYQPALGVGSMPGGMLGQRRWWQWRPTPMWAIFLILLLAGTIYQFDKLSEFIYFQF